MAKARVGACRCSLLAFSSARGFYLYFKQSREHTVVIIGQAVHRKGYERLTQPLPEMLASPQLSSIHVTAC